LCDLKQMGINDLRCRDADCFTNHLVTIIVIPAVDRGS